MNSNYIAKLDADLKQIQREIDDKQALCKCLIDELFDLAQLRDYLISCLNHAQGKEDNDPIPSND